MSSFSTLPPDPYKLLGVTKDAKLPEIRSAHRKLVLKCHPDKVQDAALKAVKQDEFQKVQQAYELLSDDSRRLQYDEQVKLFELRKEMGRGNPTPRSNPFEYEVKTASPRADTFKDSYARPTPKAYSHTSRSYEDVQYTEDPLRGTRAPKERKSYESSATKGRETREHASKLDALRRAAKFAEEDRERREKDRKHKEKKKSSDKDRKKESESKSRSRKTYVEDDSSSDDHHPPPPRSSEKTSRGRQHEEEIRINERIARAKDALREEALRVGAQQRAEAAARERAAREAERVQQAAAKKEVPLQEKWATHQETAAEYMMAARRVKRPEAEEHYPAPHPGMPRRSETYAAPSSNPYDGRYAAPREPQLFSDEETPRRSSARKESREPPRRTSDTPRKDRSSREPTERRKSPAKDPYIRIVEPPAQARKPTLATHQTAPPEMFNVSARDRPGRSQTTDYPRHEQPPPLPRAQTFGTPGDRDRGRERGSSRLKKEVVESESDSEGPTYHAQTRRAPEQQQTTSRYVVENGRVAPVATSQHRAHLRDLNESYQSRDRSESPHGTSGRHSGERPGLTRNPPHTSSRDVPRGPTRSQSTSYSYAPPEVPEQSPYHVPLRPKLATRESSSGRAAGYDPAKVSYGRQYSTEDVTYSKHAPNMYAGRRSDSHDDYTYPAYPRGSQRPVAAAGF